MNKDELEAIVLATLFHLEQERDELQSEISIENKPSTAQQCYKNYLTGKIHAYREMRDYLMGEVT